LKKLFENWKQWISEAKTDGLSPPPVMLEQINDFVSTTFDSFKSGKLKKKVVTKDFPFDPTSWKYVHKIPNLIGFDLKIELDFKTKPILNKNGEQTKSLAMFVDPSGKKRTGAKIQLFVLLLEYEKQEESDEDKKNYILDVLFHELVHFSQKVLVLSKPEMTKMPGLPKNEIGDYSKLGKNQPEYELNNEEFWPLLSDSINDFKRLFTKMFAELLKQKKKENPERLKRRFYLIAGKVFVHDLNPEDVNDIEIRQQLEKIAEFQNSFFFWKESKPEWYRKAVKFFTKKTTEDLF